MPVRTRTRSQTLLEGDIHGSGLKTFLTQDLECRLKEHPANFRPGQAWPAPPASRANFRHCLPYWIEVETDWAAPAGVTVVANYAEAFYVQPRRCFRFVHNGAGHARHGQCAGHDHISHEEHSEVARAGCIHPALCGCQTERLDPTPKV